MVGQDQLAATRLPRLVIAAPASGHGKTTVATGLMAALARTGHRVSGHKVGPDYIDPGYHCLATGRPGRNLDPHLVGEHRLVPLLLHGAGHGTSAPSSTAADLAVIEGVMGLYDGQIGGDGFASTAHVAAVTQSPVVLVVDVSHASRSIGAVVHGMVSFDPSVRVVGVILNKVGSTRHADEVKRAIEPTGVPVLGVLHRDDGVAAPSRHLGLVPAAERDDAAHALDRLAAQIADRIDLDAVVAVAGLAPDLVDTPWDPASQVTSPTAERPVVAVAGGRAFTFRYAETTELLQAAGCEVVTFDPLEDRHLPAATAGVYLGGGFPEVHATELAANTSLRHDLRAAVGDGVPTVAECAGLLYLCDRVDGAPMVGALEAEAVMTPRLTLAYRTAVAGADTLLSQAGERVTAHEFHRTTVQPVHGATPAWLERDGPIGFASATLHASYLHTHWAGHPSMAQRFADAVHASASRVSNLPQGRAERGHTSARSAGGAQRRTEPTKEALTWHGDQELVPGLIDFAVNVMDEPRPHWLDDALRDSLADVSHYPDPSAAASALARRHGLAEHRVLATAGAAEAFTLIARARSWRRPVIVHPQFTEPDVALTAAGHRPHHVHTDPTSGFVLNPLHVPADADLVIVGNPTNPTSALHPESEIRRLLAPGRVVVVDEAFMDAIPEERESLASAALDGLFVVRSLTKLWSIPGVRAGYVTGDPDLLAELRAHQPPWSVSAAAAAAMIACASDEARAEQARRATLIADRRATLVDALGELGIATVPGAAPFVLAHLGAGAHGRLREAGIAVRRADTFPGLDDSWVRIAVRRPEVVETLLRALRAEGR